MKEIDQLQSLFARFRDDRDWKQFHTPKNLAAAISIEVAELQELFLWKTDEEVASEQEVLRPRVEEEIADVFAYVLAFADAYNIDLAEAFQQKMKHNELKYPSEKVKGSAKKYNQY